MRAVRNEEEDASQWAIAHLGDLVSHEDTRHNINSNNRVPRHSHLAAECMNGPGMARWSVVTGRLCAWHIAAIRPFAVHGHIVFGHASAKT